MIQNFQKFIALFFFVWWTLGAGKRIHPSTTLHTNQRFPLLRRGFRFAKKQAQQQSQSKAFGRERGGKGREGGSWLATVYFQPRPLCRSITSIPKGASLLCDPGWIV